MGKYPLKKEEKDRIIELLENQHPSKREVFLQNAESFARWLAGACYDIYLKVKDFFKSAINAVGEFLDWLFE